MTETARVRDALDYDARMKWVGLLVLMGCAAEETRTKPEPPDMDALVESYAMPSRNFDAQAAIDLQQLVERKVRELIDASGIVDAIEAAIEALNNEPQAAAPLELEGEGFVTLTRTCAGHGIPAPPVNKDANGFLELTVGYSDDGIDPVVFGDAVACKEQFGSSQVDLAGELNVSFGKAIKLAELATTPLLFDLRDFRLAVGGVEVLNGGLDFQLCRGDATTCVPDAFELLIGLPGDTSLVFFIELATKTGGFRAANGVWTCDFVNGTCTDGTNTVVIPGYQL